MDLYREVAVTVDVNCGVPMLWVWCMQQLDLFVPSVCH